MGKSLKGKELGVGITQRKDGIYQARYINNQGKKSYVYANNLTAIRKKLDKAKYDDEVLSLVKTPNITVDEWFELWMSIYCSNIRDTTRYQYSKMYNKIKEDIGYRKLKSINLNIIQNILNDLPSDAYRKRVRSILYTMFERAVDNDYIRKNPVKAAIWKIDDTPKKKQTPMTAEQEEKFVSYIYKPRYRSSQVEYAELFEFMLQTGMRVGEASGLTWDCVDFEKSVITVNKTLATSAGKDKEGKRIGRYPRFHKPKTKDGNRTIPMTKRAKEILLIQKEKDNNINKTIQPLEGFENLVFVSYVNKPIYDDCIRRMLKKVLEELKKEDSDFPDLHPHILRHTFATRCIEKGVNYKTLQTIMGHSDFAITLNVYSHTTNETLFNEMKKIEN